MVLGKVNFETVFWLVYVRRQKLEGTNPLVVPGSKSWKGPTYPFRSPWLLRLCSEDVMRPISTVAVTTREPIQYSCSSCPRTRAASGEMAMLLQEDIHTATGRVSSLKDNRFRVYIVDACTDLDLFVQITDASIIPQAGYLQPRTLFRCYIFMHLNAVSEKIPAQPMQKRGHQLCFFV